jgi:dTDP-glucose 4,6-dehydratase
LFVEDHARALRAVFERGVPGETYNVGGNAERKNIEVVRAICATLDRLSPRADGRPYADQISFVTDRPGHDQRYAIDAAKIKAELGWAPQIGFEEGIARTVRWYLDNRSWWGDILAGRYDTGRLGLAKA